MPQQPITVAIADDHPLFRTALKQAIGHAMAVKNVAEADDFPQIQQLLSEHPSIELVFLDLYMPGNNGFTGLSLLQNLYPDLTIIMVSSDDRSEIIEKAKNYGAAAFIPKSATLDTIIQAIICVLDGQEWFPQDMDTSQNTQQHDFAQQLAQLTPQQFKVLSMVSDGLLNKQIAYELNIKETTIKQHVSAILNKLSLNNRTQAGIAFQQLKTSPIVENPA